MDFYVATKELAKESETRSPAQMISSILATASQDMLACIAAGCQLEMTFEGEKVTIRTKQKVSILRDPNGVPISIIVDRRHEA